MNLEGYGAETFGKKSAVSRFVKLQMAPAFRGRTRWMPRGWVGIAEVH